jgi:Tol biopolymer transport system component/tRNA A-37 threonylcarbamoyl transferase component Bud32
MPHDFRDGFARNSPHREEMDVVATLKTALAGRYELEREIGAGGMATVYLARDVKHNRRVALKVLKPELGAVLGGDRFLAEIEVTANLQHPNLLPLFDSGAVDGLLYYVMPYVDGETLRHRLEREKQLPVDEVLTIAVAVASALEYAHAHGVIHRDLKPENILLQAGQPVVADFGIALAVTNAGGQRVTQSGVSLGTPQYMSPEQATGDRAVDARADIYSLGAVVYEMLTGEPPHSARTAQATIAKLLTEEARSVATLRRAVPEHMDGAVLRALEKLPADRFTSARSFADALQGKAHVTRVRTSATRAAIRNPRRMLGVGIAAGVVAIAAGFVLWRALGAPGASEQTTRVRLAFEGDAKYAAGGQIRVALSPDGSRLAYVGGGAVQRIYVKGLEELEPRPLAGTEQASNLQFSPDGEWIAFQGVAGMLKKVRLSGGAPVTIADTVERFSWGDGDVVVFTRSPPGNANRGQLWRTSAMGGQSELVAVPDSTRGEFQYSWPHLLPDAKAALVNVTSAGGDLASYELAAIRLADGSIVRFGIAGLNPRYVASGHLLYSVPNGTVMAAPFDARRLQVTGPAVVVLENIVLRGRGAAQYSVSRNGTLIYVNEGAPTRLVMTDRTGRQRMLIPEEGRQLTAPRFSPDGKRLAVTRMVTNINWHVWVYDIATGASTRLTTNGCCPTWTADGRYITWYVSGNARGRPPSTFSQRWDASEPPRQLFEGLTRPQFSPTQPYAVWATQSNWVLVRSDAPDRRAEVLDSGAIAARISPDGRWIAFQRGSEAGPQEVYVQALPGPGGRRQISTGGGTEPAWGATSAELFYRNQGALWSATLVTAPEFTVVRRDSLFAMNVPAGDNGSTMYDVSPDGKSFAMPWFVGEENPPPVLVTGWFIDLRQRMAAAAKTR